MRRIDDERLITAKRGRGETREEIEVPLESGAFDRVWKLTESRRIAKRRFRVPLEDGHCAEVDVYAGDLEGLVVAEVEFSSGEDSDGFRAPKWFGRELTADHRYANRELAMHGRPKDRAYRLKIEESPPAGMRRIATGRIDKALERLAEAQEAEDLISGVHGVRKDLKKLRSELRLLRHELGGDLYRAENGNYRDAGRLLSTSRDAEVKVETLEDICERCEGALPGGRRRMDRQPARGARPSGGGNPRRRRVDRPRRSDGADRGGSRAGRLLAARAGILEARQARNRARLPAGPQADAAHRRRAEPRQRPRVAQASQGPLVPAEDPRGRDSEEAPQPHRGSRPPRRRARRPPRPRRPPRRSPPPRVAGREQGAAGRGDRAAPAGAGGGGV